MPVQFSALAFVFALFVQPTPPTAVDEARALIGTPVIFGSRALSTRSVDFSSLVQLAYHRAGIELPRTVWDQWDATERIDSGQPGDLVFFGTVDGKPSHVALVVGDNAMVDARFDYPLDDGHTVELRPIYGTPLGDPVGYGRVVVP